MIYSILSYHPSESYICSPSYQNNSYQSYLKLGVGVCVHTEVITEIMGQPIWAHIHHWQAYHCRHVFCSAAAVSFRLQGKSLCKMLDRLILVACRVGTNLLWFPLYVLEMETGRNWSIISFLAWRSKLGVARHKPTMRGVSSFANHAFALGIRR